MSDPSPMTFSHPLTTSANAYRSVAFIRTETTQDFKDPSTGALMLSFILTDEGPKGGGKHKRTFIIKDPRTNQQVVIDNAFVLEEVQREMVKASNFMNSD